uniref:Uncharacterized protein n=1 Tax=Rhizophora mucronata TaxID=61149 RepID=A0A2P2MNF8_RHIMU
MLSVSKTNWVQYGITPSHYSSRQGHFTHRTKAQISIHTTYFLLSKYPSTFTITCFMINSAPNSTRDLFWRHCSQHSLLKSQSSPEEVHHPNQVIKNTIPIYGQSKIPILHNQRNPLS